MKLEEAVEILEDKGNVEYRSPDHDYRDALKLNIEASKAYCQARRLGLKLRCGLLPGETKD